MTTPFYVSPEQFMKDRADFARNGIARGRSVVVVSFADGIILGTQNPSRGLHKISEIYDRIAFGAVGKFNEFENLRITGIRYCDLKGYAYDRSDVNARGLANSYAESLGQVFTNHSKPFEVELVVAELGNNQKADQLYRIAYDGSVTDERGFAVLGGNSGELAKSLSNRWSPSLSGPQALEMVIETLNEANVTNGLDLFHAVEQLEIGLLNRKLPRRTFQRLGVDQINELLDSRDD